MQQEAWKQIAEEGHNYVSYRQRYAQLFFYSYNLKLL